jgi:hypothetical protein
MVRVKGFFTRGKSVIQLYSVSIFKIMFYSYCNIVVLIKLIFDLKYIIEIHFI